MPKRSASIFVRRERAYPVRLHVLDPPDGWGQEPHRHTAWARENLPPGAMEWGPGQNRSVRASSAFYFRDPRDAVRFLDAFPHMRLADDVDALGIDFGRGPGNAH